MTTINQKEYLKKYLSIGSDGAKSKKRKKKTIKTIDRVKIIDDDIDVNLFNQAVEEDLNGATEDAPQIVGVIDDRPPELRIDDYRKSDKWKPVGSFTTTSIDSLKTNRIDKEIKLETKKNKERSDSDRDLSPVRVKREPDDDLSPRRSKTLDGKKAGLRSSDDVVKELSELKKREDESFRRMPREASGKDAKTVFRDRKTGRLKDFEREAEIERAKQAKEAERSEKYTRWGRGSKQVDDMTKKYEDDLKEMSKPLARYADDEDLEKYLKEMEREGDPMLAYLRKKRKKNDVETGKSEKPQFEGSFAPNRYGIKPGHRWDGVDRSNGYESRFIQKVNSQSAQQEDVYKWSTEDM